MILHRSPLTLVISDLLLPLKCGANEKYNSCGSTCVETCTSKPQICTMACKAGCFCATGYVRRDSTAGSPCIKREDCKTITVVPKCGENEEYQTCGTACPPRCDDLRYPLPKPPKPCILLCKAGCFCKAGFYRNEKNKCVPPQQCCGNHERYLTCGTACPETCQQKPTGCIKRCVAGCFCGCSDYVRLNNSTNSPCVHREDCPKECSDDEDTE